MIAAFIARWHYKTSSFYLPVGEVTVTLDDVVAITMLPLEGTCYLFVKLSKNKVQGMLETKLGMTDYVARVEDDKARGPHIHFGNLATIISERAFSQNTEN